MNNWKKIAILGILCFIPYIGIPLYITVILAFLANNKRFVKNGIIRGYNEIGIDMAEKPKQLPKFERQTFTEPEKLI